MLRAKGARAYRWSTGLRAHDLTNLMIEQKVVGLSSPCMRLEKAWATAVCAEAGWRAVKADDTHMKQSPPLGPP